jgi:hypothetical protein
LEAITNIAALLIADEYTRDAPIVVMPAAGPRIRVYTVHGAAAIDDEGDETPPATWPLIEPGWRLSLPPCSPHVHGAVGSDASASGEDDGHRCRSDTPIGVGRRGLLTAPATFG